MGDNKNVNDQEDVSVNADFSTQSNESYNFTLALSTTQVEQEFVLHIIEGLKSQKKFKDVSYLKLKQDSISLKAYNFQSHQTVFIKVKKHQKQKGIQGKLEHLKDISKRHQQYFVQILDFWCLQQDQYDLFFQEIEYLPQNIIEFLDEQISSSEDISQQEQVELIVQVIQAIKFSENLPPELNIKQSLQYYLMNEQRPKLLLKAIESQKIEDIQKREDNLKDNLKNRFVVIIENEFHVQNNTQIVGMLILLFSNWQNLSNQYIYNIDQLTFADYIKQGKIDNLININKSNIFYQMYLTMINQNNLKNTNYMQACIDYLLNNKLQIQIPLENNTKKENEKKDIYQDSEDDDQSNKDGNNQTEQSDVYFDSKSQGNNLKIQILNPNLIINKYINSIQNCQFSVENQESNLKDNQSVKIEKNESLVKSQNINIGQNSKTIANESDIKQINQEEKVIEIEDVNQNNNDSKLQISHKFQTQNNSKVIQLNNKSQIEKVIVLEDFDQTPTQSNLFTSQKVDLKNKSNVIYLSNQKENNQNKRLVEDIQETPTNSKRNSDLNQNKSKIIEDVDKNSAQSNLFASQKVDLKNKSNVVYLSNQKENNQDKPLVEDIQETPLNSKRNSDFNKNKSKIIVFSNKKENDENKIDISYNHNNDIVLEMKDADAFGYNNVSQQKNFNNSGEVQNPLNNYQRYLYELGVECEDPSEIFIMEYMEQNGCCPFQLSCIQPVCYIRLKLFCSKNPLLGKSLLDVIFLPFINIFNKSWIIKKKENVCVLIFQHLFLWFVKVLNLIIMLLLVTLYLTMLLVIIILVHLIYLVVVISLGVLLVPFGLARYYIRICYKMSDFKSSIIYQKQNSFTWFQYDYNFSTAREFKSFCHKMMHRRYQYLQSPSKNIANF